MHMTIEPLTDRVWDEDMDDFRDTYECVGYAVYANDGTLLATGDTRAEALSAAQEFLLLPTRKLRAHV
ncbi:hypothetical protein BH11PAT2_BH11PAT2_09100 [soil metagenome]